MALTEQKPQQSSRLRFSGKSGEGETADGSVESNSERAEVKAPGRRVVFADGGC
jgi:hypothetical protein